MIFNFWIDTQEAAKNNSRDAFARFQESTMESLRHCTLRGQLELVNSDAPVSLDEVEPASEIVKRFVTGGIAIDEFQLNLNNSTNYRSRCHELRFHLHGSPHSSGKSYESCRSQIQHWRRRQVFINIF